MQKAFDTAHSTGRVVVCLVPVRSSSAWWHELVLETGAEVRYVKGRLTFGDAKNSAAFASAIVVYRPTDMVGHPGKVTTVVNKVRTVAPPEKPAVADQSEPVADEARPVDEATADGDKAPVDQHVLTAPDKRADLRARLDASRTAALAEARTNPRAKLVWQPMTDRELAVHKAMTFDVHQELHRGLVDAKKNLRVTLAAGLGDLDPPKVSLVPGACAADF